MNEVQIETEYRGKKVPFIIRKRSKSDPEQVKEVFRDDVYGDILDRIKLKGKKVLDIGAYIGDTMVLFHLHGAKRVLAFEPHPLMYRLAIANARLNGVRFKIWNVGLSDKKDQIDVMGRATRSFGLGIGPFLDKENPKHHQVIKLKPAASRIKKLVKTEGKIHLVKIDCEGYETKILPEIAVYLELFEHVIVECHGVRRRQQIEAIFKFWGMKIREVSNEQQMSANKISTLHASW